MGNFQVADGHRISLDSVNYEGGDTVEMDAEQAKGLLDHGSLVKPGQSERDESPAEPADSGDRQSRRTQRN